MENGLYKNRNLNTEKDLFSRLPKQFINIFQKKIQENKSSYGQTISELRTAIIFSEMGIKINEIDYKTINNKNVDFLAIHGDEKIYVEVKGFIPKNDESVDTDESKISRAIVRAVPKFFDTSCNILVIADEDTLSPPLFLNPCVDIQRTPEIYLNICDKVSAIIILGGLYEEYLLKFKIGYNVNPRKALPEGIIKIFNQRKSN